MSAPSPTASLDPAEVAKFSALAAEWWNPKGPFGALHRINPLRLGFVRDRAAEIFPPASAAQPLQGLTLLDVGCGGGLVTLPLARLGADALGLDASADGVGAAQVRAQEVGSNAKFRHGMAEELAVEGRGFDIVTALEILEHVPDPKALVATLAALVKPGGLLVTSSINRTAKARAFAIFGAEKVLKWAPDGAHDYEKLVMPEEVRAGAPELIWNEPVGISFEPLGRGWTLSSDVSVNYLLAGRKPK
jgi:2-polyprenyl-6-hydroxyphenyl methylase/3-demethylubiquinone-9 3-methyltransferase